MGIKIKINEGVFSKSLGKLLLLDRTDANYAFSVARRLSNSYTGPAMLVRRSTDNEQIMIGFNNDNGLDENSLTDFSSGADVFVVELYDQIGNTKFSQSQVMKQPKIVSSGIVVKKNGKPAMEFDGISQHLIHTQLNGDIIYDQFINTPAITIASVQSFNQKESQLGTSIWFPLYSVSNNIPAFSLRSNKANTSIGMASRMTDTDDAVVVEGHLVYEKLSQVFSEALFAQGISKISVDNRYSQEKTYPRVGTSKNTPSDSAAKIGKAHFEESHLYGHFTEFVAFDSERFDKSSIINDQIEFYSIS